MNKRLLKDALGWGVVLWLIGYVLGFAFFFILPTSVMGWAIMPMGAAVTVWVLFKKIKSTDFEHYLKVAVAWAAIAVAFDYVFLVMLLKPADGYYKLDVYLYYALTFALPLIIGWRKKWKSIEQVKSGQNTT